jgi:hypothetical protein
MKAHRHDGHGVNRQRNSVDAWRKYVRDSVATEHGHLSPMQPGQTGGIEAGKAIVRR